MFDLRKECDLLVVSAQNTISGFDCGDAELNDYFNDKAIQFKEQMLAQTVFFRHIETEKIVCAFSMSPNALKTSDLPRSRRKKVREHIPREKLLGSYPAFLIGRLGVAKEFSGYGIGSQLMYFIKTYCLFAYTDFCRFFGD